MCQYARVVHTVVVRLGDECTQLSFERVALRSGLIHQHRYHPHNQLLFRTRWLLQNRVHVLVKSEGDSAKLGSFLAYNVGIGAYFSTRREK